MLIATHDGSFHADEATACAVLTYIYENSQIIRSRDPLELEKADIIIDVSGINDEKHFDHHSKDFKLSRENGVNYATAGLMWHHFGLEYLKKIAHEFAIENVSPKILEAAFKRIDKEIMIAVDLNDNGQLNSYLDNLIAPKNKEEQEIFDKLNAFYLNEPSIPYLVAMMNLPNVSAQEQNRNFQSTVKILRTLLQNAAVNALYTEIGIARVLELYDGSEILIIHERLPWSSAVREHFETFKNCYLAVYPDRKRGWRVQALPYSPSNRFKNKITAPKVWCGLNDEQLDEATGLKGTIFVHRSGFTGGAMDYETNLELAKKWLKLGDRA